MKELIGKTIHAVYPDTDCIIFSTNDGGYAYISEGDCCSHSWFSAIQGMEALIGATVNEVEEVNINSEWSDPGEFIQIYGIKITTNKGRAMVEFRNSSNGYYGGWCQFAGEREIDQRTLPATDDWSE